MEANVKEEASAELAVTAQLAAVRLPEDDETHDEIPVPCGAFTRGPNETPAWLIVRLDQQKKSAGGILLPGEAAEASAERRKATVLIAGHPATRRHSQPGTRVVVAIHDAHRFPIRVRAERGEVELRLVNEDAILATLVRAPEALRRLDELFAEKSADVQSFTIQGEVIEIPTVDGVKPEAIGVDGPSSEDGSYLLTLKLGALTYRHRVASSACPLNDKAIPEKVALELQRAVGGLAELAKTSKIDPA